MLTLNIECLDPIVQASVYKTFSQIIVNFVDNNHESLLYYSLNYNKLCIVMLKAMTKWVAIELIVIRMLIISYRQQQCAWLENLHQNYCCLGHEAM